MRILVITNLYPNPFQPNRAPFNRHQFRLLSATHQVRIIAPILWTDLRAGRRTGVASLPANGRVELDGLVVDHPTYWYTPKVGRPLYGHFYQWSIKRTFATVAAEFQPDLILASWAYPDGWAAVRLARHCRLPVVVKVHGSDVRLVEEFPGRSGATAQALRAANGVVAVSRDLAQRVVTLGADPTGVRVIVNSVDKAVFHPGNGLAARARLGLRSEVRHLLSVGNLTAVKGPDVLLDACARLSGRIGPWQLHMVGAGSMRAELGARAERLGLSDRVRFHGSVPHSHLPDWYRAADLFILASRSEGVPNVLLEAAACGCPFVATAVGGVPEVAHLGSGRLVLSEQADQLTDGIVDMLARPRPSPVESPRDSTDAAAELAAFLQAVRTEFEARPRPSQRRPVVNLPLEHNPAA